MANSPPKHSDFWSENHKVVHVSGDDVLGANQSQNNSLLSKTEGPKVTLAHDESGKEYKSALSLGKKPIKKGVSLSKSCLNAESLRLKNFFNVFNFPNFLLNEKEFSLKEY